MFLTLTPIDSMKNLLTLTFSILLASSAWAQSADEYFHGGAQSFINADLQTAINQVQNGLNNYPNDPKLNALMQKLQEENEEQQEQQEQQESEGENQEEQDPQDMNPEDLKSQQISKEDAEKILQALAQKEKELLKEFKKKKSDGSAKHEKDW